ncbi:hypothetical protein HC251_18250 [Iamia sp. SCSIO 61187]|nr:DUF6463 family protein [Iamia sp. SCSIO 61187]QYG94186.1 hypothetical protein HC251_18250 [Iamia sp. SCSIO 61187]
MIRAAGWIMALYATAHTVAALTFEGAAGHADEWFTGGLWDEDFSDMTEAGSALWLSLASFGPPLFVIGLTVLWMDRHGITPPPFIAWILGTLTLVDAVINPFTPWPIIVIAHVLLLVGARRAGRDEDLVTPASSASSMPVV